MLNTENKKVTNNQPSIENSLSSRSPDKPDAELMRLMQIQVGAANPLNTAEINPMLAQSIESLAPRDNAEAMLITQMVSTHNIIMTLAIGVASEIRHHINERYTRTNALTKLLNAYTRQMEALTTYRGKQTNQKITVEQVTVESGGQAIVGNVNAGGSQS
jgi:hypothetical protein